MHEDEQESLASYLQAGPPSLALHTEEATSPPDSPLGTANDSALRSITTWHDFTYDAVRTQFSPLLDGAHLPADPMAMTPPCPVRNIMGLKVYFADRSRARLRRALRATFSHMKGTGTLGGRRAVEYFDGRLDEPEDEDGEAGGEDPDFSFVPAGEYKCRLPGVFTTSASFRAAWREQGCQGMGLANRQYTRMLAKVERFMRRHGTRYGVLITEQELVAITRVEGEQGHLQVSNPVGFSADGTGASGPKMTVLLALWYLAMLASDDGWCS